MMDMKIMWNANNPLTLQKTVGAWKDITGSSAKHRLELIIKVSQVHYEINKSPLPMHLIWIGLRQATWKSIEHVLEVTTILRKESDRLVKELHRLLLPKLGCNRNFPLLLRC